jgi:predicted DNA-binding protein (MmcQ/YjbR family)
MADVRDRLREFALSLPDALEDFPWGERVAKVKLGERPLDADDVTVDLLCDWVEESYRIVAPMRLVAKLDRRN